MQYMDPSPLLPPNVRYIKDELVKYPLEDDEMKDEEQLIATIELSGQEEEVKWNNLQEAIEQSVMQETTPPEASPAGPLPLPALTDAV